MTTNFAAAVKEFLDKNALVQLPETDEKTIAAELAEVFSELLRDADKRRRLAENALAVMEKNGGATEKTLEYLQSVLQVHNKQ